MSNEPLHYALDLPVFQTLLMLRKAFLWLQGMTNHFPFSKYFLLVVPSLDLLSFHHQHLLFLQAFIAHMTVTSLLSPPWQKFTQISGSISMSTFFLCFFVCFFFKERQHCVDESWCFPNPCFPPLPPQMTSSTLKKVWVPFLPSHCLRPAAGQATLWACPAEMLVFPHSPNQGCTFRSSKEFLAASYTTQPGNFHWNKNEHKEGQPFISPNRSQHTNIHTSCLTEIISSLILSLISVFTC